MLKEFVSYIKSNWVAFLIGGLLAIVSGLLAIVPNYIIRYFVDGILAENLTTNQFHILLLILFGVAVAIYLSDAVWVVLLFGKSSSYARELRTKLFQKLLELRSPFYQDFRSGDLITRMTSDIDSLSNTLAFGFLIMVQDGTWMISVLSVMLFTISWQLTLVAVIPLILFGVFIGYVGIIADKKYEESRDAVAQLSNEVLEVVEGVRVMRAYGKKEIEQARFQERTQEVVTKANDMNQIFAIFVPAAKVTMGIAIGLGLGIGAYFVDRGMMTVGQLIAFQIYLGMLNGCVWGLSDIVGIYQSGKVSFRKIDELAKARDHVEPSGEIKIPEIDTIEFADYSFTYPGDDRQHLQNIDLRLDKGKTLGIVGPTGAGKSTLVKQLLRQFAVSQPEKLKINGHPITELDNQTLAALIGYVPQDHILFSRTVRENILFGNKQAEASDLGHAIEMADFTKDIGNMAEGLETLIGEKGVAISGGQKQRVSMARALIRQPDLLILDDSLSAVDAKTEQAIIANIQDLRKGSTNIIITHRLSAVAHADWVVVIQDGRITEEGSPQDLLDRKGWYYEQYQRQQMEEV